MRKLILATENFPYGKGERTFILPEIERLRQHFDILIISHANSEQRKEGMCEKLPENIKVVCFGRPILSFSDKLKSFAFLFLDRDGRTEIKEILRGGIAKGERFYQALAFLAQTLADQKKLRKSGILSDKDQVIYYSFWYTYYCYSMVRERHRYPNVTVVSRTHGVDLYHERVPGDRQPYRHQMEKGMDAILFACEYGADYYRSHVMHSEMGEERLHVCKLGTENPSRQMPIGQGEIWELLSCSNVIPLKRIHLIIDGLSQIEGLKIHWTHIGDGSEMRQIQEYAAKKLGSKNTISYTFAGYVKNVNDYYAQHQVDCFITVSETEGGCPVSIQEAMSYGIPVIGTSVGGITEMFADNGILLSANPSAMEVAEAVRKIMTQDRRELENMKRASYLKWAADFTIDQSCDKVLEILNKL